MPSRKLNQETRTTTDKAAREINRLWGDVPVVDATNDLRVFMCEDDIKGAMQKDPAHCVFARACQRSFGSSKVLFFRSVAYVELPKEDGSIRVERFQMGDSMRSMIEAFDRGEKIIPQAGFLLKAPRPSDRLDAVAAHSKSCRKRKKARLLGEKVEDSDESAERIQKEEEGIGRGKGRYRDKPLVIDLAVRNGTGSVHFTSKTVKDRFVRKSKKSAK